MINKLLSIITKPHYLFRINWRNYVIRFKQMNNIICSHSIELWSSFSLHHSFLGGSKLGNLIDVAGQSTASTPAQDPSYGPWVQQYEKQASGQHPTGHSNSSGAQVVFAIFFGSKLSKLMDDGGQSSQSAAKDFLVTRPAEATAAKQANAMKTFMFLNNEL